MRKNILRVGAFIVDGMLFNSLATFCLAPLLVKIHPGGNLLVDLFSIVMLFVIYITLVSGYGVLTNRYFGGTIGKVMLNLHVTDLEGYKITNKNSFSREFMKWSYIYVTVGVYGLVCLYRIFNGKEAYHDIKYKTMVK